MDALCLSAHIHVHKYESSSSSSGFVPFGMVVVSSGGSSLSVFVEVLVDCTTIQQKLVPISCCPINSTQEKSHNMHM